MFPIKPLFDKVIVREIPVEELFTEDDKKLMPLDDVRVKLRNRQGIVVAVGPDAEIHVAVEDRVYFEDTAMYEQMFLRAIDEFRPGVEKFWQIRVHDLKGIAVDSSVRACARCKVHYKQGEDFDTHMCVRETVNA